MDWVDSTDENLELSNALRQPFEVLRPVPTQATARVQKVQTGKGKDKHQAMLQGKHVCLAAARRNENSEGFCWHAENLLRAFPPAFPEETVEQQCLRQEACKTCWTALSQHLEVGVHALASMANMQQSAVLRRCPCCSCRLSWSKPTMPPFRLCFSLQPQHIRIQTAATLLLSVGASSLQL